jgi:protein phosphatase
MYTDHFTLDVSAGDRIIVCSDGLSSMISDKEIEDLSVSSVTPQAAADTLVSAALTAGGHDNVTVVVVDVLDDGLADIHRKERNRNVRTWLIIFVLGLVVVVATLLGIVRNSWYLGNNDGTVGIYRGINDSTLGIPFFELIETTSISVSDLPEATRLQLDQGIAVENENEGRATVERYRDQIDADKTRARQAAEAATSAANQQGAKKNQEEELHGEQGEEEPPAPAQPEEPGPESEQPVAEAPAEAASSIIAASEAPQEGAPTEATPAPEAPAEVAPEAAEAGE